MGRQLAACRVLRGGVLHGATCHPRPPAWPKKLASPTWVRNCSISLKKLFTVPAARASPNTCLPADRRVGHRAGGQGIGTGQGTGQEGRAALQLADCGGGCRLREDGAFRLGAFMQLTCQQEL